MSYFHGVLKQAEFEPTKRLFAGRLEIPSLACQAWGLNSLKFCFSGNSVSRRTAAVFKEKRLP